MLSIDHLSPEAIAAFVDGELPRKAVDRAASHLAHCDECRAEVHGQQQAARALREDSCADSVSASHRLMQKLRSIPELARQQSEIPESEKHYLIAADGCRKPECLSDALDLFVRKFGSKSS